MLRMLKSKFYIMSVVDTYVKGIANAIAFLCVERRKAIANQIDTTDYIDSKYSSIASLIFLKASLMLSPSLIQPGKAGT